MEKWSLQESSVCWFLGTSHTFITLLSRLKPRHKSIKSSKSDGVWCSRRQRLMEMTRLYSVILTRLCIFFIRLESAGVNFKLSAVILINNRCRLRINIWNLNRAAYCRGLANLLQLARPVSKPFYTAAPNKLLLKICFIYSKTFSYPKIKIVCS